MSGGSSAVGAREEHAGRTSARRARRNHFGGRADRDRTYFNGGVRQQPLKWPVL
jgi:hypothetical protein